MENSQDSHPRTDTLLAVMSEQLKNVLKSVESIEKKLDSKVDLVDFVRLEKTLDDHRKENDVKHKETSEKVNGHAIKIAVGGALLTAGSWLISIMK